MTRSQPLAPYTCLHFAGKFAWMSLGEYSSVHGYPVDHPENLLGIPITSGTSAGVTDEIGVPLANEPLGPATNITRAMRLAQPYVAA